MCHIDVYHYKCGHRVKGEVRKCKAYRKQKREAEKSICLALFWRRQDCGHVIIRNLDDGSACSSRCAEKLREKRKRMERDLKQREKERVERAAAGRREYERNKRREEEALRRQREAREEKERMEGQKKRSKSKQPISKSDIKPLLETARGGMGIHDQRPDHQKGQRPVQEAQRPPPRLAKRPILPQAYSPSHPPVSPNPQVRAQTAANLSPQGGKTQVVGNRQRSSSAVSSNSSLPRREGKHQRSQDAGTALNSRTRSQATRHQEQVGLQAQLQSQRLQAKTQSPPRPRPQYPPGPPVPPKDVPPIPQKDARRELQHPELVPAPLRVRPKPTTAAEKRPSKPNGYRADPSYTAPPRKPVEVSQGAAAGRERRAAPSAEQPTAARGGYRPNPMFANRPGGGGKARPAETTTSSSRAATAETRRPAQKPATAPQDAKKASGNGWLKKLVATPSTESVQSVEWVCKDASRVERGSPEGRRSK